MPRNVTVLDIGPEYVNISWRNPVKLGTPNFNQFTVRAVSSINEVVTTINATDSMDPDYINTFTLMGLKPNTEYSLNVTASSTVNQLGILISEPSEVLFFRTMLGGKYNY